MRRPKNDRKPERDVLCYLFGAWSILVLQALLAS